MESSSKAPLIIAAVLGAIALSVYGYYRYVRHEALQMLHDYVTEHYKYIAQNQTQLVESLEATRGLPLFLGNSSDASAELGSHMRWTVNSMIGPNEAEPVAGAKDPVRFDSLAKHFAEWGDQWNVKEAAGWDLDASWMAGLRKYDHWEVFLTPQLQSIRKANQPTSPHFDDLVVWSKFRLARGMVGSDLAAAQKEVTHLALLLWSTELTNGAKAALEIFYTLLLSSPAASRDQGSHSLLSPREIAALEVGLNLGPRFVDPATPLTTFETLFSSPASVPFLCIAMRGRTEWLTTARLLLYANLPAGLNGLAPIINAAKTKCRDGDLAAWPSEVTSSTFPTQLPGFLGERFEPPALPIWGLGKLYPVLRPVLSAAGYFKGALDMPLAYLPTIRLAYGAHFLREGPSANANSLRRISGN